MLTNAGLSDCVTIEEQQVKQRRRYGWIQNLTVGWRADGVIDACGCELLFTPLDIAGKWCGQ